MGFGVFSGSRLHRKMQREKSRGWMKNVKTSKNKTFTVKPYSRAGRVEVERLRKAPVVFAPTRLGVEPRMFPIYDVGVPGESRCLFSIPLNHTRVWPLRGRGWKVWPDLGLMLSRREDKR
jgi:hypothetical protein